MLDLRAGQIDFMIDFATSSQSEVQRRVIADEVIESSASSIHTIQNRGKATSA
jgi:hypothetical protein